MDVYDGLFVDVIAKPKLACLVTTLKNISGGRLHFSFLPPHGRTLENNQEIHYLGDYFPNVEATHAGVEKYHEAFLRSLTQRLLMIVKTPNPILFDANAADPLEAINMVSIEGGLVQAHEDPCWEEQAELLFLAAEDTDYLLTELDQKMEIK